MNRQVALSAGRAHEFTRNERSLEKEGMERGMKLSIARARWIYHCQRVKRDMKQSKRLNVDIQRNKLNRRNTNETNMVKKQI